MINLRFGRDRPRYARKGRSATHISVYLKDICKKIAQDIGYERMMILRHWKDAFPKEYYSDIEFSHLRENKFNVSRETKNEDAIILYIKCTNSSTGMMIFYQKIEIIEKMARIIGCRKVVDIKISR
ncbi:MAG: DciA family protein [Romboutsia sp.]